MKFRNEFCIVLLGPYLLEMRGFFEKVRAMFA